MMRFLARLWLLGPLLLLLAVQVAQAEEAEDRSLSMSSEYVPGQGDGSGGEVDCIDCDDDDRDGEGDGSEVLDGSRYEPPQPHSQIQTGWLERAAEQTVQRSRDARSSHPKRGPPARCAMAPV